MDAFKMLPMLLGNIGSMNFYFIETHDKMCIAFHSHWPMLTDVSRTAMHLAKFYLKSNLKFFRVGQGHES